MTLLTTFDRADAVHRRSQNRIVHLEKMWVELISHDTWPQVDRWLSRVLSRQSRFGGKDRKWYADTIFSILRNGFLIGFFVEVVDINLPFHVQQDVSRNFESYVKRLSTLHHRPQELFEPWNFQKILKILGALGATSDQLMDRSKVDKAVNDGLEWLKSQGLRGAFVRYSLPLHLQGCFESRSSLSNWSPRDQLTFLEALLQKPPMWVRVASENVAHVVTSLEVEGFRVDQKLEPAGRFAQTLAVSGKGSLYSAKVFEQGELEVQDAASQCIGLDLPLHPHAIVWDCCSGGGGKTLQIASRLKNKGAVFASDIRSYKLEEVRKRARRARLSNIRILPWNGADLDKLPKEASLRGGFDVILVDAPCSSSGTWRRNPDAKYRLTFSDLEDLAKLQVSIVEKVVKYLKPGGCLVYATCSWLPLENEAVVERILAKIADLALERQNLHGSPSINADTMFSAVLRKSSESHA